jgi:hypothetical protein
VAKNSNGEGSIYEHKRNGKKVGYRGATRYIRPMARSAATLPVRPVRKCAENLRRQCPTGTVGSFSMLVLQPHFIRRESVVVVCSGSGGPQLAASSPLRPT